MKRANKSGQSAGMRAYQALLKKARKAGFKGKKRDTQTLKNYLAKQKAPAKKAPAKKAASKPKSRAQKAAARRRKRTARSLIGSARRSIATRRKSVIKRGKNAGQVRKSRPSVAADLRRVARRVEKSDRDLATAIKKLSAKAPKSRKRKNPGHRDNAAVGSALGFVGGFVVEQALAGGIRKVANPESVNAIRAIEFGVPVAGSLATHFAGAQIGLNATQRVAVIAGMLGGAVARNVDAVTKLVLKVPGLSHLAKLGSPENEALALGEFYAGAAGMGRYVTSSALSGHGAHSMLADDLYAGQAGVGRYMLDDTANFGMGGMDELHAGAAGFGEYIQEPAALDGYHGQMAGAHDDDMEDLMDDLGSVPVLTPDEEQAENILIPELAYEAMEGLGQTASKRQTLRARTRVPVIRTTRGMAAKVQAANIGEIIGESRQVPGTVLVATSVAGRDINQSGGAFVPSQRGAFKNPGIKKAENISVSPYGVFSRGIFTSTLPVHGQISR
tara:strand:+ start:1662 stop:3164 length:1503 start_codon:yes stop_codon:yes gene_type:complete